MKDNLTITQWAKVMGYKKLDSQWWKDTTTGEKVSNRDLLWIQANTKIDFENKKIHMLIGCCLKDALYYNQQVSLCDAVGAQFIEFVDSFDELD